MKLHKKRSGRSRVPLVPNLTPRVRDIPADSKHDELPALSRAKNQRLCQDVCKPAARVKELGNGYRFPLSVAQVDVAAGLDRQLERRTDAILERPHSRLFVARGQNSSIAPCKTVRAICGVHSMHQDA